MARYLLTVAAAILEQSFLCPGPLFRTHDFLMCSYIRSRVSDQTPLGMALLSHEYHRHARYKVVAKATNGIMLAVEPRSGL